MALKVADRVQQNTNTAGSGTLTLTTTPAGFQSFGSVLSNNDTTYYVLTENNHFEIGVGTYSSHSLVRSHILQSSNSDNKINLGGSGTVFIGYPADKSVYQNEESQVVVGASGIIFNGSTVFKDVKLLELNDIDSSGTQVSTHLMSFNMTRNGLTIGDQTGWSNGNTLIGHQAGNELTTGNESTMVGYQAGYKNQVGNNNTFIGHQAGPTHPSVGTTIYNSTALGYQAGNKMGINNTAIGYQAAISTNSTGFVAVGASTGSGLGSDAVAVGRFAGKDLTDQYAIAIGYQAGYEGGGYSSAWLGYAAGYASDGATRSIGLGYQAGKSSTGDDCIYLGNSAGQSNTTDDYFYVANAAPASNGTLIKGDMTNKRVAVGKADITLDSTLHVGINTATHVGLIVKSASAQSADLTQWQNAAGSSVAAMAKSGVLTVNGLYASGAGLQIADATPAVTTNAIYNAGGTLYFNGDVIAVQAPTMTQFNYASGAAVYASGNSLTNATNIVATSGIANYASGEVLSISPIANYASGQSLSLSHASGIATSLVNSSGIATYASGQALSLTYASGLTPNIATNTAIANYASGQALSLTHASGLTATNAGNITTVTATANYASGQALSLTTASGVANYASGQALSLANASGIATYASGVVTGGNINVGEYIYHAGDTNTYLQFTDDEIQIAAGGRTYIKIEEDSTDKLIINHGALDIDVQIKGDTDANLIRTDAAADRVGLGTSSPAYRLDVVGAGASGLIQSSGILIGPSGIGVGTTTPAHPIDVVQHSGVVRASGMHSAISMNADAATVTFDLDQATTHGVTLGGGRTLALSNVQIGDKFLIRLQQDATGSRTVTWFDHISWAGGSAPTLTTTAHKADLFGFLTASGTGGAYWFDGLVVGQNI